MESPNEGSSASGNDDEQEGQEDYEEKMMERIKKFYIPINLIPEIESEIIEYIEMEERGFMEQLFHDDFLFTVVRDLFSNARMDKCTIDDECKSSLVMMIT